MRKTITLLNKRTGKTVTGYTVKIYSFSHVSVTNATVTSYTAKYTMTDNNDGTYYSDITSTMKGSVVITTAAASTIIPKNLLGILLHGDDVVEVPAST